MSMIVPNEGKIVLLEKILFGAGAEDLSLRLFRNNITPAEGDVAATYTIANFTGYSSVTLTATQTGSTWAAAAISSNIAFSTYQTNAVFTITASTQTVYGIYFVGAVSTKAIYSQAFPAGKPLDGSTVDTLTITPVIQFGHL